MNQLISIKDAERKAFRMTFQDGLWDIFLGIVILQFATIPLLTDLGWGDFWSSMAILPVYFLVWFGIRRMKTAVVVPRVGLVNYQDERKRKIRKIPLIASITLVLGLIFGLLFFVSDNFNEWLFPLGFSIVALGAFSGAAYYLDFPRLIVYGVLTAMSPLIGQMLYVTFGAAHHGFPITFGISGLAMIVTGLILFARFLQKYSRPDNLLIENE